MGQFSVVQGVLFLADKLGNIVGTKQISGELDSGGNSLYRLASMLPSEGPVTPGTVALKSILVGGQFNTTLPTLTNGQQCAMQFDSQGRLITATSVISPYAAATFLSQQAVNTGIAYTSTFTSTQRLAVKQFYAGGTGIGKQALYRYLPNAYQLITPYGDFESAGDLEQWTVVDPGGNNPVVSYSTDQAFSGTGSAKIVFTKSDQNNYTTLRRTFSTAADVSSWRYVTAEFYNTVSTGGAYTRNLDIILTDANASTRTYRRSGLSTASPFNASGWIKITGEIEVPFAVTGTSFDTTNVVSIDLKFWDSANRSGTVYWDTARVESQITIIFPIYHQANVSFNIPIDPVVVLEIGDQILMIQKNSDTARKEYFALAGGVAI